MTDRKVRWLVVFTAIFLLIVGAGLFYIFDMQGIGKNTSGNYVNYDINDYVEVVPVTFNTYSDVYSSINVSRVNIKNLDKELTEDFVYEMEEIIGYITGYYNEIKTNNNYMPINTVTSTIKMQVNGAVLSIFYRVDFELDANIFSDNIKSYVITYNIDLGTNKILTNDVLLSKYNYNKEDIADKLFSEDILINKNQLVVDKETNITITRSDIERKKDIYIDRIIDEFDNIIEMYIDNGYLVLVYDSKELKNTFFDNKFDTDVKLKHLQ